MSIYELLEKLNIKYEMIEHQEVYTASDAAFIKNLIVGIGVKNLFLKNKKQEYFLVLIEDEKIANIKNIEKELNIGHLSFANESELEDILNVKKGSVSPLGLLNDHSHNTVVIIDDSLKDHKVLVHPNINTRTIAIDINDLIKFIKYLGNKYYFIKL